MKELDQIEKSSEAERKLKEYHMTLIRDKRRELYKKPELRHLFLEVTSKCNANCLHCGSRCDANEQGEEISAEELKKTLKDIAERYGADKVFLNITGGEPLVRKDLFDILEYAVSLGFHWGMTSNGMLINERMLQKIEKAKMETVSISIDGLPKTHEEFRRVPNSFDRIMKGIHLMQSSPVIKIVQVTTVANKKNIHELEDLYQLLLKNNVEYWRVVNCDPIGRAQDNQDILLDKEDYTYLFRFIREKQKEGKMKDITYGCSHYLGTNLETKVRHNYFMCYTGLYVGSILSNGDIFVCPNVPRRKELIQGNIKTDNFLDVWMNKYEPFRNELRTSNENCLKCVHWSYCGGDSMHTWNFEEKKPNICLKEIFEEA